ncbi:MAG: hypothetical protein CL567_03190 [Alphaproteobacteria bacterium]|nr:hypothetical protein [Alphaproteobacteria bacterium]|tara:strand:- start:1322 stop:2086 length:765 start_codon:yes stop_codon:yes gene_type:complete
MTNKSEEFTFQSYSYLINEFLNLGYSVVNFSAMNPLKQHLILRHDIDMSLEAALPIAEIERNIGVKATYFILLRSDLYNPFSETGLKILKRLYDLGHEIGLHFDASLYSENISVMNNKANIECELLERILERKINVISFHRPSPRLLNIEGPLSGRIHTYQPKFFKNIGYCSDSRGGWYYGHPLKHSSVLSLKAIQLLTHPIWWSRNIGLDPIEVLDDFREKKDKLIAKTISSNCDPYRNSRGEKPDSLREKNR